MTLQQTARLPEGGDEWTLAGEEQTAQNDAQNVQDTTAGAEETAGQVEQQAPATPQLTDLDRVAMSLGWTPQHEWRGDPNKWTPADQYIRNTGQVLNRTKSEARFARAQAEEMSARLARLEKGQHTIEAQRFQQLNEDYENAKFEAAKNGDTETYRKLVDEQQKLMSQAPRAEATPSTPAEADVYRQAEAIMQDPIAQRFFEGNPVALQDDAAWSLMDREMSRVAQAGGGAAAQFRAAEEALRYAYPQAYERRGFDGNIPTNRTTQDQHHSQQQQRQPAGQPNGGQFANQQRRPAPPMNAANGRVNGNATSAVDKLPAEAKDYVNKQIAAGKMDAAGAEEWATYYQGGPVVVRGRAMGAKA